MLPKCCQSVSRLAVLIEENYKKQDKHRPRFRSRYGLAASRQSLHGHSSNAHLQLEETSTPLRFVSVATVVA